MAVKNFGVDLSRWNVINNYDTFLSSTYNGMKIKYAFLRLGFMSNGVGQVDSLFQKHYNNLVGKIPLGVYIYSYATSVSEAKKEAQWVLSQIKNLKIEFPIVFDYEDQSLLNLNLSRRQYTDICKAFLDEVKANNYYVMMYCNPNMIENYLIKDEILKYPLWLAHYTSEGKQKQYGQLIWQFGTFTPKGAVGEVDANFAYEQVGKYIRDNNLNKPVAKPVDYDVKITATKTVKKSKLTAETKMLQDNGYFVHCDKVE